MPPDHRTDQPASKDEEVLIPVRYIKPLKRNRQRIDLESLRRTPETEEVSAHKLDAGEFESDRTFVALYVAASRGRQLVAQTRVRVQRIQCGFSKANAKGELQIVESPPSSPAHVKHIAAEIRGGERPSLHLYRGGHEPGRTFVCSDDTVALRAYQLLGVRTVPAVLLNFALDDLEYPAFTERWMQTGSMGRVATAYEGPAIPDIREAPCFHRTVTLARRDQILAKLTTALQSTLAKLRRFHLSGGEVHYHHSLASILIRAIRLLSGIRKLVPDHPEQALLLVRSLYELSLNLCLDWLAPELIGTAFLHHARGSSHELTAATDAVCNERIHEGWAPSVAQAAKKGQRRLLSLVGSAQAKASFHPLRTLHRDWYARLSHLSHQDFVAGEHFLNALAASRDPESATYRSAKADVLLLLRIADCSVAVICDCISSDIGDIPAVRRREGRATAKDRKRTRR